MSLFLNVFNVLTKILTIFQQTCVTFNFHYPKDSYIAPPVKGLPCLPCGDKPAGHQYNAFLE